MIKVEAGFKIKETKEEAEKILLENGFVNTFKTAHTRDIYFGKNVDFNNKSIIDFFEYNKFEKTMNKVNLKLKL